MNDRTWHEDMLSDLVVAGLAERTQERAVPGNSSHACFVRQPALSPTFVGLLELPLWTYFRAAARIKAALAAPGARRQRTDSGV